MKNRKINGSELGSGWTYGKVEHARWLMLLRLIPRPEVTSCGFPFHAAIKPTGNYRGVMHFWDRHECMRMSLPRPEERRW